MSKSLTGCIYPSMISSLSGKACTADNPLILHIPHSSIYIPKRYHHIYLQPDHLHLQALAAADLYTDHLYRYPATTLRFPVSRLLCDVERFRDPAAEVMTQLGMWICYTHTMDGEELARFNNSYIQEILSLYYDCHHRKFSTAVTVKLQDYNQALIVDCHSFSPNLPYYPPGNCPDICLGQDAYHTPPELVRICCHYLESCGYTVAVNFPFRGSIVPQNYYRQDQRVHSIMIEISRKLYATPDHHPAAGFTRIQHTLYGLLQLIEHWSV